jgi:predicted transcriptional regulator
MDHVAILTKKYKFIEKILSGEKTIESRWYVNRIKPWLNIKPNEKIYLKNSGGLIEAVADVEKVLFFSNKENDTINNVQPYDYKKIFNLYARDICIQDKKNFDEFAKSKNYCILIFLKNPKRLKKAFNINKTGYGNACAWLITNNINDIKI